MIRVTVDHYLVIRTHLVNLKNLWVGVAALPTILICCMCLIVSRSLHIVNLANEVVIVEFPLELVFCHLGHTLADSLRVDPACAVCDVRTTILLLLTPLNPLVNRSATILLLLLTHDFHVDRCFPAVQFV